MHFRTNAVESSLLLTHDESRHETATYSRCLLASALSTLLVSTVEVVVAQQASSQRTPAKSTQAFTMAEVAGRVVGQSNDPIDGAVVALENLVTQQHQETVNVVDGVLRVERLAAGEYKLIASAPG